MHDTFTVDIPKLLSNDLYRKIVISKEGVAVESSHNETPLFIYSNELAAFRYGMKFITGYAFTVGRHYFIEIKTEHQKSIVIKFSSYYGFRKKVYRKAWRDIVTNLWNYYFVHHYLSHYYRHKNGENFEFFGMAFHESGISWDNKNLLPYTEIGLSNYVTYFMVYNKQNKSLQKSYNFMHDWNALALQSLLKTLMKEYQSSGEETISDIHP